MKKRILSIMIAIILVVGLLPNVALTALADATDELPEGAVEITDTHERLPYMEGISDLYNAENGWTGLFLSLEDTGGFGELFSFFYVFLGEGDTLELDFSASTQYAILSLSARTLEWMDAAESVSFTASEQGEYFVITKQDVTLKAYLTVADQPVYVGGVKMLDGEYLGNGATVPSQTEPDGGYAFYKDGVLTLHDYVYEGEGYVYDSTSSALICGLEFDILLEGENRLTSDLSDESEGIISFFDLTIGGAGSLAVNAASSGIKSIYGDITVDGNVTVNASICGIKAKEGNLTISGGNVTVNSGGADEPDYGLYAFECITISGGNMTVNAEFGITAIGGDLTISGSNVTVNTSHTAFTSLRNIRIGGTDTLVDITIRSSTIFDARDAVILGDMDILLPLNGYVNNNNDLVDANGRYAYRAVLMTSVEHEWSDEYSVSNTHHWRSCSDDGCRINQYPEACDGYAPHSTDGACECGYDVSREADIYVGGVGLIDGEYLSNLNVIGTTAPDDGYAYYGEGKLTLHGYVYKGEGYIDDDDNSAVIYSEDALDILFEGENSLTALGDKGLGIISPTGVTIDGTGSLTVTASYYTIASLGEITLGEGVMIAEPDGAEIGAVDTEIGAVDNIYTILDGSGKEADTVRLSCNHLNATVQQWDENDHWDHCERCGNDVNTEAHTGGSATCQAKARCEVCNTEYGTLAQHSAQADWITDETHHYHLCVYWTEGGTCQEHIDLGEHTDNDTNGKCDVCDYQMSSGDTETDPIETETDPIETETDPVDTETDPVDTDTDPVDTETDPVDTDTDPVDTETDPVDTDTDPVNTETDPVDTDTDPVNTETDSVDTDTDPVNTETDSVNTETDLVDTDTDPVEPGTDPNVSDENEGQGLGCGSSIGSFATVSICGFAACLFVIRKRKRKGI